MPIDTSSVTPSDIDKFKGRAEKKHTRTLLGAVTNVAGGAAGGAAAAGTVASAAGVTTLCGSTALASALGGIFVTTTPIGWTIGAAVAGAAVAGAAGKLMKSGMSRDRKNSSWFGDK